MAVFALSQPRRLALVFPPAMHPTSPTLGLATIKAYLDTHSETQTKNFDLNLRFFDQALDWLADGRLKARFKDDDHAATAARVAEAMAVLTDPTRLADFLDPATYDRQAGVYLRFENLITPLFAEQARRLAAGMEVPPLFATFYEQLVRPVVEFEPQVVGLSILYSQQLPFGLALARLFKDQGIGVVLGGATLAVMPRPQRLVAGPIRLTVARREVTVDPGELVDALIVGEGEPGLAGLIGPGGPAEAPGLIAQDNGDLRINPRAAVNDLGQLPLPDFDDFDLAAYHAPRPVLPYLSARGCWWRRCVFCTHRQTYQHYRAEDFSKTVARLQDLARRYKVEHFNLVDEMVHPRRMAGLADGLIKAGAAIRLAAYGRPTADFEPGLLDRMHRAGVGLMMWGVESASQRVLDLMAKGTRVADMGRLLDRSRQAGIANLVFVMFGFPTETMAEIDQTLEFIDQHRASISALSKSRFLLLENAPMLDEPAKYGLRRVRPRTGSDLTAVAHDFEVDQGPTSAEVDRRYLEELRHLSAGASPHLAILREHLLIHAAYGCCK